MPIGMLLISIALIFLPYDDWIKKTFFPDFSIDKIGDMFLSFLLWFAGYIAAVFISDKFAFLFSSMPLFKKSGSIPIIKKIRHEIHPLSIFPVIK